MTPELSRAIIKCIPEYFSWNEERREKYRVAMPPEDDFSIRQFLLKEIFDLVVNNDDELQENWRELDKAQCTRINSILLPFHGIGEEYFYLNESFADHKSLLSFETLYDYDYDDYQFQERSREKDFKNYVRRPYKGTLYFTWAHLMVDGAFSYGSLTMVAGYILSQLEEFGHDLIEKLIPHEVKCGDNYGKREGDGYLLDFKVDALGLEPQLDELNRIFFKHIGNVHERIMGEFDKKSLQQVVILNESTDEESDHHFLFTDKEILKRIRFKTFLQDCRAAKVENHTFLDQKVEAEKILMEHFLTVRHEDIMENYDPKIIPLHKKNKLIAHPNSGLDELLDS